MKYIKLSNDVEIPILGLGTWKSTGEEVYTAVRFAIESGYTHIDTASVYENEEEVGKAIQDSHVDRSELFVTTKLWNTVSTYEEALQAFETSLKKLKLDYIDLYLIHWPGSYDRIVEVWKAMEELYRKGNVKAIGVSNFNVHHLNLLMEKGEVKPVVNQVECHIKYQNVFLQEFCHKHNIYLEAYAPLMSWEVTKLLEDETLLKLASKYNKTATQIALRWLIQREIIPLPKSVTPNRIKENIEVFDFELTKEEMNKIRKVNFGTRLFIEPDNMDFGFFNDVR